MKDQLRNSLHGPRLSGAEVVYVRRNGLLTFHPLIFCNRGSYSGSHASFRPSVRLDRPQACVAIVNFRADTQLGMLGEEDPGIPPVF